MEIMIVQFERCGSKFLEMTCDYKKLFKSQYISKFLSKSNFFSHLPPIVTCKEK